MGWGEVASPVASALRAHHVVFMHSGLRRRRQGTGPTRVEVVGRPQSPALPPLRLVERGGRAPTPPLYKERTGATGIRTPSPSFLSFWFPSPTCNGGGNPGPSSVAARVSARQRAPPPLAPMATEPTVRGRGRGRGRGRDRGRGRGARGGRIGAPSLPSPAAPFLPAVHLGDDPCEFIIRLRRAPRRRLRLPAPFASVLEVEQPETLNLRMRGCGISGTRVHVESRAPGVVCLGRGWKTFARIHSLTEGFTLHFKLVGEDLLSVKAFWGFGIRARCCEDSSSDSEGSSSSESDEEGSDSDDEGCSRRDDGSD